MTVLSYLYVMIMDHSTNAPGHGNNIVYGLNATENIYLKEQMEIIGKLASNEISKIGMLPSASKYASTKISGKCLHIIINRDGLNGFKVSTKIQNRE